MDKYDRISELCGVPAGAIDQQHSRIEELGVEPEDVRAMMNAELVRDGVKRAKPDLIRGFVVVLASVVGGLLTATFNPTITSGLLVIGLVGLWFVFSGIRALEPMWQAKKQAEHFRAELEGPDGFLWRFQGLLEFADADGPIQIHESLIRSCELSKGQVSGLGREDLLMYWHWVTIAYSHLGLAHVGAEDPDLKPRSAGSGVVVK